MVFLLGHGLGELASYPSNRLALSLVALISTHRCSYCADDDGREGGQWRELIE